MKQIKRRLAAIMFTDIVGYTAMMQQDETIARKMRDRHREVFNRFTEKYEGEILQYYGDGTLSIYPSSSAAVQCALEIQRELKKEPAVSIRIGIHTGEISYGEEDVYGDGVNIASRIESRCVPGGIFISEKVYDDIKNNTQFKTKPLGSFSLKNIENKVGIFALANEGASLPEQPILPQKAVPMASRRPVHPPVEITGNKKKHVAGLLAIFFGLFGTHRFYLGQRKLGLIYLISTMAILFVIPGLSKLIPIVAITAFIDGILMWTMPKAEFDAKFNAHTPAEAHFQAPPAVVEEEAHQSLLKTQFEKYKEQAMTEYRELEYENAIVLLKKAAELKNHDPEVHYLLACCYSLMENAEYAILHLDAAVAFGLKDQIRIISSGDLAFLRTQPIFEVFSKSGYRLPKELPTPGPDLLQTKSHKDTDLLEQLNKLQALKEKGIITEEEFIRLKPGETS